MNCGNASGSSYNYQNYRSTMQGIDPDMAQLPNSADGLNEEQAQQFREWQDAMTRQNAMEMYAHKSMHDRTMLWLR